MKINFAISPLEEGQRLDKLLAAKFSDYSRSYFEYLFQERAILCNGQVAEKRKKPKSGDQIALTFLELPKIDLQPQEIPLDILYEDEFFLAINKPAGMVVHPAPGNYDSTFVNALLFHLKDSLDMTGHRPGIVHRLDKDTSGVLLAAKSQKAHEALTKMFANREIAKTYLAICLGNPGNTRIEAAIGRHPVKRKEMTIREDGKEAITECRTLSYNKNFSFVQLTPLTGRTHQIRVHLKSKGCPILGDKVYGNSSINKSYKVDRQMLHAYILKFVHPFAKKPIEITAPPPEDFKNID